MTASILPVLQGVYAPNALGMVYTAPNSKGMRIERFTVTNQTLSTAVVSLYIKPAGMAIGVQHRLIYDLVLAAKEDRSLPTMYHAINPGDEVHALCSVANAVTINASGTRFL